MKTAWHKHLLTITVALSKRPCSFNPKPEAMAVSSAQRPHQQTTIASGFGLNEYSQNHCERVLILLTEPIPGVLVRRICAARDSR